MTNDKIEARSEALAEAQEFAEKKALEDQNRRRKRRGLEPLESLEDVEPRRGFAPAAGTVSEAHLQVRPAVDDADFEFLDRAAGTTATTRIGPHSVEPGSGGEKMAEGAETEEGLKPASTEAPKPAPKPKAAEEEDLESMTVTDLQALARKRNVDIRGKTTKAELVAALRAR